MIGAQSSFLLCNCARHERKGPTVDKRSSASLRKLLLSGVCAVSIGALAACGISTTAGSSVAGASSSGAHATESAPPGDIPDTVAYVKYQSADGKVQFTHPEGWSTTNSSNGVQFTDKLNSVTVSTTTGPVPTVASVKSTIVPKLGIGERQCQDRDDHCGEPASWSGDQSSLADR